MIFEIIGQFKSGKNNMGINPRSGRHYPLPAWADWRNRVVNQLLLGRKELLLKPMPYFRVACAIQVHYYAGDHRRRDVPGMLDALCHCLERAGIIKDDSLVYDVRWESFYDEKNPRCWINIVELERK